MMIVTIRVAEAGSLSARAKSFRQARICYFCVPSHNFCHPGDKDDDDLMMVMTMLAVIAVVT